MKKMSSTVEQSVRKSRLSLSLKRSHDQAIAVKNNETDNNEKLNKFSTSTEITTTSSNNMTATIDENNEEEIIPCSQTEDNLVFSLKSDRSNCNVTQASITPEKIKENPISLEHDHAEDSSLDETKVDDNSFDIFNSPEAKDSKIIDEMKNSEICTSLGERKDNKKIEYYINEETVNVQEECNEIPNSPEAKISKILNERKGSKRIPGLLADIKEPDIKQNSCSEISSFAEVDVSTISDKRKDNEKMECSHINEILNVQGEYNGISNSLEVKIFKILEENEGPEESKCSEKKDNDFPPIITRNVVIADSDEEFEEFANQKRKSQKNIKSAETLNSEKENSTSKRKEQTKASSSSCKEKSKVLNSRRDKNNVSKTDKEKSKSLTLKRKLEFTAENSDDEFEKPRKQAKKTQSPQRYSVDKEVEKSKKLKRSRRSKSLATEVNC